MLSAARIVQMQEYSGSVSRVDLPDPADNSRSANKILATIQKVLGKPAGSPSSGQVTLLKIRDKERSNTLAGRRDRSAALRKDTEPFTTDY